MPANLPICSARDARPAPESHRQPVIYPNESHTEIFKSLFCGGSGARREESPLAGDAFELVDAVIVKTNSGT
jgi:hypothetical protein